MCPALACGVARDELQTWMAAGGRRRDRCRENPACAEVKAQFSEKIFAKRCDKPQRATFRDGSKTEPLRALCPCSCTDVETPEGPLEEVSCYQDEIEVQVYNFLQDVPAMLGQTSGQDLWYFGQYVKQYFLDIVFMEHGPMVGHLAHCTNRVAAAGTSHYTTLQWTLLGAPQVSSRVVRDLASRVCDRVRRAQGSISMLFTLSLVWRMLLRPFLQFFYKGTVLQAVVSVPTALIFAPLPTLFRLFASPIVRWIVFVEKELMPFLRKTSAIEDELAEDDSETAADDDADGSASKPKKKEKVERDLNKMKEALATGSGGSGGVDAQLRKRKAKKVSKADIEAEKERVLLGKGAHSKSHLCKKYPTCFQ